ncbi:MAG: YcgL domain-containing protein [Pseudomonadales bacterium]|nr:YcgL domain-containing protein [Pseudomonadales bacterium]
MKPVICSIYRSSRKEGMYLYVAKTDGLKKVPEALKELFGTAKLAMTMLLGEDKKLARVDAQDVLSGIAEKGFYLQMPPADEFDEMTELARKNTKLPL